MLPADVGCTSASTADPGYQLNNRGSLNQGVHQHLSGPQMARTNDPYDSPYNGLCNGRKDESAYQFDQVASDERTPASTGVDHSLFASSLCRHLGGGCDLRADDFAESSISSGRRQLAE